MLAILINAVSYKIKKNHALIAKTTTSRPFDGTIVFVETNPTFFLCINAQWLLHSCKSKFLKVCEVMVQAFLVFSSVSL